MISRILTGNLFWILFFLFVVTSAQARNEYLNNGTNTCAQGEFSVSVEQRDDQYNYNHNSPTNNYECKRVPRINPPPPEFAELINMCMKVGVMSSSHFVGDRDYDPKISYWTVLKQQYMKENPDIITLDNYKK
jgi:hypothetical protein